MTKAKERKIIDRNKNVRKDIPENTEGYVERQTKFEAYTGKEPYLFVRCSHRDTAKVYPVLDALYECKYRLRYDESCETGNDFHDELRMRIENVEAVLLLPLVDTDIASGDRVCHQQRTFSRM